MLTMLITNAVDTEHYWILFIKKQGSLYDTIFVAEYLYCNMNNPLVSIMKELIVKGSTQEQLDYLLHLERITEEN